MIEAAPCLPAVSPAIPMTNWRDEELSSTNKGNRVGTANAEEGFEMKPNGRVQLHSSYLR